MRTALKDRVLWFDGDSTVNPDTIADMVLSGMRLRKGIHVETITPEIERFNSISTYQLGVKTENRQLSFDWDIPERYLTMNVEKFLLRRLDEEVSAHPEFTDADIELRISRLENELELFYECNLNFLLRTSIYIVDSFIEREVVWGVGRGSSCASYILYLIGVHDIDSVKYELDPTDFLRA